MQKISIIPTVKTYISKGKAVNFKYINYNELLSNYENQLLQDFYNKDIDYNLTFHLDTSISKEGYFIDIYVDKITITYASPKGKHNAIITLFQMLRQHEKLCECHIFDEPDFEIRSIMIDISRNKVPKLETLKMIVDELALVKINELQLYIEGRSFYFESFPEFYEHKDDFLTGEDVLELSKYCLDRNIELIPNINCFGHMGYWLNQKKFSHLKLEKNFYWEKNGLRGYSTSLNPECEESYQLIFNLFEDLLKYYPNVDRITIGGDEPFELLFPCKNKNANEIYKKHMSRVVKYIKDKNLTPWMWGDVVKIYPEILKEIDANFLEWGYEAGQFNDSNCSFYQSNKKNFIVCCGTSLCNNISGRMDNMMINYQEAAFYGVKYHAAGMMITDWNDAGAYSQIPSNLLSYIYGSCFAYNHSYVDRNEVNNYLNKFVFKTDIATSIIELGRYVNCQDDPSTGFTKLMTMLFTHQLEGINYDINSYSDPSSLFNRSDLLNFEECVRTERFLDNWLADFNYNCNNHFCKEIMFSYKLLRHSLNATKAYLKLRNIDCDLETIEKLLIDINQIIEEYDIIWNYRNKISDYYYSSRRFKMLKARYKHIIAMMKGDF